MKALFFLLLAANLVLAFYIQSGPYFDSGTKLRPELQPEKIKLLFTPAACLELEGLFYSGLQLAKANVSKHN